jgi:hypothetical protein
MRICEICFDRPVAEPGARRCRDCDCQRAYARGTPQPLPSAADAERVAGWALLQAHDAAMLAAAEVLPS